MVKPPRQKNVVHLSVLYNAFEPETVEKHELAWRKSATLSDYLEGLPEECEWMVFLNGEEIQPADKLGHKLSRGDQLGLVLVPQGGDGFKSVLRVLMQVAMIAVQFIPGIGQIASIGIAIGLGLASAFLLAPKAPKKADNDDSRSYGIDGAKNSATENIPYPVIYGEFRTAGNLADCFTKNVGDDQYLYMRVVLNDGEVESVEGIELNEQPISSFTDVEYYVSKGTLNEAAHPWFDGSTVQSNKSQKIDTGWVEHYTTSAVDKIRWDVAFSQGLVNIDSKKGDYSNRSVTFQMEARQVDPVTREPLGNYQPVEWQNGSYDYIDIDRDGVQLKDILRFIAHSQTKTSEVSQSTGAVQYRKAGTDEWVTVPLNAVASPGYIFDASGDGSIAGDTDITPYVSGQYDVALPRGDYEVRAAPGAQITRLVAYPSVATFSQTVTDSRTRQIRRSFESAQLAHGFYQTRIRRTNATSTDQYKLDEVYLTDVAEITVDPVAMRGTAYLALKIKLNEQLSAIPTVTARVKGSRVQLYDIEGNPTEKAWTNNPAWCGVDILAGIERGAGVPTRRIDWPRIIEFAEYCAANNITFNGVFDTNSNLSDALRAVWRIGHAAPIPFGTKISVAVDKPREPVASFTQANILKGSLELSYMSMADRSNEYEITYYDRNDRNKQKTIRYVDPKAVTFNEISRVAQVSFPGIDNVTQATKELWRAIYQNRLLIRTLTFDTAMDSINVLLGDVALIQHDMMAWANSGRLFAGSTTRKLVLDQNVQIEAGARYSTIVHFDAIHTGQNAIYSIVGQKLLVTGDSVEATKAKRLIMDGQDYEIVQLRDGNPYHTITLAVKPPLMFPGTQVNLWATDVVLQYDVTTSGPAETNVVELVADLPQAPAEGANFIFGKIEQVRKPYTLTGISGSGIEKRRLTFVEYHEGVYGPAEVEIPIPVTVVTDRQVPHVSMLLFDYERLVAANRKTITARVHWNPINIRNYAGADVYVSINGSAFRSAGSAVNSNELMVAVNEGDVPEFKVVAYNTRGDRAPFASAPSVKGTVAVLYAALDGPRNVAVTPTNFAVVGVAEMAWDEPADMTGVQAYEARYRRATAQTWTSLGEHVERSLTISGLDTGNYVAQVRSTSDSSLSEWVEKKFSIAVSPYAPTDPTKGNNRDGSAIMAPITSAGDVEHVINSDGSADISFEWEWKGKDASIDGFEVAWSAETA
ncbi:Putative phage tail protein [Sphingomonas sp. NFR04]|uniref:phage tail protein n=1 Tax=Sphingomonas sp. NFR04 TaxID=1566283 RepID=UPI0008F37DB0|nr:phage tail protein [Sphingomonas sp. NFR04]SFJ50435.1 Putative phage tail protein [Sphingomonas sp. NFR04]